MKYLVFYVEGSTPKVKEFETSKAAKRFATRFTETHNDDDNWVDVIIYGEVIDSYPNWYGHD